MKLEPVLILNSLKPHLCEAVWNESLNGVWMNMTFLGDILYTFMIVTLHLSSPILIRNENCAQQLYVTGDD